MTTPKSNKFRISTNGECFRIECLKSYLRPNEKNPWYHAAGPIYGEPTQPYYSTLQEASIELERLELEYKRQNDTWSPVSASDLWRPVT